MNGAFFKVPQKWPSVPSLHSGPDIISSMQTKPVRSQLLANHHKRNLHVHFLCMNACIIRALSGRACVQLHSCVPAICSIHSLTTMASQQLRANKQYVKGFQLAHKFKLEARTQSNAFQLKLIGHRLLLVSYYWYQVAALISGLNYKLIYKKHYLSTSMFTG